MLYSPVWECPVCFHQLGKDEGFLPMLIASCRPVAHMICYRCSQALPLKDGKDGTQERFCPICNEPAGEFVPVSSVVNEEADPEARRLLEGFEYNRLRAIVMPMGVINASLIVVQRVEHVYNRALKELANYGGGGPIYQKVFFEWNVPGWDLQNVRLILTKRGFRRVTRIALHDELRMVCDQLQSHLDKLMADTEHRIVMSQSMVMPQSMFLYSEGRFIYLPFMIQPRNVFSL